MSVHTKKQQRSKRWWKAYTAYMHSSSWKLKRKRWIEQAGGRCSQCYASNFLQVHHLSYARLFHEEDYDVIVLCKDCHQRMHPDKKINQFKSAQKRQAKKRGRRPCVTYRVGDPLDQLWHSRVEAAKTTKGGWTKAQLAEWGIPWPPPKGWKAELERKEAS